MSKRLDTINIAIIDDHHIVLEGMRVLAKLNERIVISISESEPDTLYSKMENSGIDLILMDLILKDNNL